MPPFHHFYNCFGVNQNIEVINVPEEAIYAYATLMGEDRWLMPGFIKAEYPDFPDFDFDTEYIIKEIVDTLQIPLSVNYAGGTYSLSHEEIWSALGIPRSIYFAMVNAEKFEFWGEDADGTLHGSNTNGYGCWWGENGYVKNWGSHARVFFEGSSINSFVVGQYPGQVKVGESYPTSHILVFNFSGKRWELRLRVTVEIVEP